ncbi:MAG: hypothetical protein NTW86_23435 [Candidatus Sumerlaeota bacterium]|nr:hypothetical protein [Candidatus Sumerlaeota bacterium]
MCNRCWILGELPFAAILLGGAFPLTCGAAEGGEGPRVAIVADPSPGPAARHGLGKLEAALEGVGAAVEMAESVEAARGDLVLVAGLSSGTGPAASLVSELGSGAPEGAEALLVHRCVLQGRKALLVCGSDDQGLMYAELDVADRIGWTDDPSDPLRHVVEAREKPDAPERALSIYTMQRAYFESHFYDERYWARYFDLLAASRFNTFALILGYSPADYLAPPYPFFFDLVP